MSSSLCTSLWPPLVTFKGNDGGAIGLNVSASNVLHSLDVKDAVSDMSLDSLATAATVMSYEDHPQSSLHDIITTDVDIYLYSCWMGLIRGNAQQPLPGTSPWMPQLLRAWSYFLHLAIIAYIIVATVYGIIQMALPESNQYSYGWLVGLEMLCSAVPFITMYPAVMRVRKQLKSKRSIPKDKFIEALKYSMSRAYRIFHAINSINILSFMTTSAFVVVHNQDYGALASVVFGLLTVIPSNLMLTGIYAFLLVEQRINFYEISVLKELLDADRLTDHRYIAAGQRMEKRDGMSAIDWLLITACLETAVCVVLLIFLGVYGHSMSVEALLVNILFVISSFSREVLIFNSMLFQVMKVNGLVDIMLRQLSFPQVLLVPQEDSISSECMPLVLRKLRRVDLYIAMKEYRIGSTVMHYRPSRAQLLMQILSVSFALSLSILKIIVDLIIA